MPYQQPRTPIGQRNQRVTIEEATHTDDGMGGTTVAWATVVTTWADVVPLDERHKEALAAQQIIAKHAYHVDIAYRDDVFDRGERMRLMWRGKTLQVHSAEDDLGRRQRLLLLCGETK